MSTCRECLRVGRKRNYIGDRDSQGLLKTFVVREMPWLSFGQGIFSTKRTKRNGISLKIEPVCGYENRGV